VVICCIFDLIFKRGCRSKVTLVTLFNIKILFYLDVQEAAVTYKCRNTPVVQQESSRSSNAHKVTRVQVLTVSPNIWVPGIILCRI
jgi:hypothetical protein